MPALVRPERWAATPFCVSSSENPQFSGASIPAERKNCQEVPGGSAWGATSAEATWKGLIASFKFLEWSCGSAGKKIPPRDRLLLLLLPQPIDSFSAIIFAEAVVRPRDEIGGRPVRKGLPSAAAWRTVTLSKWGCPEECCAPGFFC